eukprot:12917057-Prorocentrum_lima.AAC.1
MAADAFGSAAASSSAPPAPTGQADVEMAADAFGSAAASSYAPCTSDAATWTYELIRSSNP